MRATCDRTITDADLQLDLYPRSKQPRSMSEANLQRCRDLLDLEGDVYEKELEKLILDMEVNHVLDQEVVQTAGPGSPLFSLAAQNSILIKENRALLCRMIIERIALLLRCDNAEEMSPLDLIKHGLMDPVKVFVKNEPHLKTKVSEQRFRLICSVSIVSNTIARMMYSVQNNMEIAQWDNGKIPSMSGFGASKDSHVAYLGALWSIQGKLAQTDMSGWDWSVQEWQLQADAYRRIALCNASPWFAKLIWVEHAVMARKVFLLSDGRLFAQKHPGLMASGWYLTTSTNSFIRAMMCRRVGAGFYRVMGDDSVEEFVEGAPQKYLEYGHRVKQYVECVNSVEFCSREWVEHNSRLVTWERALYRLLSDGPSEERLMQFVMDLRDNEELPSILESLRSEGWGGQPVVENAATKSNSCASGQEGDNYGH